MLKISLDQGWMKRSVTGLFTAVFRSGRASHALTEEKVSRVVEGIHTHSSC